MVCPGTTLHSMKLFLSLVVNNIMKVIGLFVCLCLINLHDKALKFMVRWSSYPLYYIGTTSRLCGADGVWLGPDVSQCVLREDSEVDTVSSFSL